jgi:hypothetical protein
LQKAGKVAHVRSYPADTHLIVLKGALTILPEGRPPGSVLPTGSYAAIPSGLPYITATKGQDVQWLEYHPGPVDPLLP